MSTLISDLYGTLPLVWAAAVENRDEQQLDILSEAFDWSKTPQGALFWDDIEGEYLEGAKKLQPHLFRTKPFRELEELKPWPELHDVAKYNLENHPHSSVFSDHELQRFDENVTKEGENFWECLIYTDSFNIQKAIDMRPDLFGIDEKPVREVRAANTPKPNHLEYRGAYTPGDKTVALHPVTQGRRYRAVEEVKFDRIADTVRPMPVKTVWDD